MSEPLHYDFLRNTLYTDSGIEFTDEDRVANTIDALPERKELEPVREDE